MAGGLWNNNKNLTFLLRNKINVCYKQQSIQLLDLMTTIQSDTFLLRRCWWWWSIPAFNLITSSLELILCWHTWTKDHQSPLSPIRAGPPPPYITHCSAILFPSSTVVPQIDPICGYHEMGQHREEAKKKSHRYQYQSLFISRHVFGERPSFTVAFSAFNI